MKTLDRITNLSVTRLELAKQLKSVEAEIYQAATELARELGSELPSESVNQAAPEPKRRGRPPKAQSERADPDARTPTVAADGSPDPDCGPVVPPLSVSEAEAVVVDVMPLNELLGGAEILQALIESGAVGEDGADVIPTAELEQAKTDIKAALASLMASGVVEREGSKFKRIRDCCGGGFGVSGSPAP